MAKLFVNKNIASENSGAKILAKLRLISEIKLNPELQKKYLINEKVLNSIVLSMKKTGYDYSEPIIIWKETGEIVDGHTRFEASKLAGFEEVPVVEKSFENLEEAKKYTDHRQLDRRNLTQAEIYEYATELENVDIGDKTGEGRASERLAEKLGISASTIEKARTVKKRASDDIKDKIKRNEMTIHQGYQQVRTKKSQKKDSEDIKAEKLSDSTGNPSALNFSHSDGIERPTHEPGTEDNTDNWLKEKNIQVAEARKKGFEKGFSEGTYELYEKIFNLIESGKTPDEVKELDLFSDFSYSVLAPKLGIEYSEEE